MLSVSLNKTFLSLSFIVIYVHLILMNHMLNNVERNYPLPKKSEISKFIKLKATQDNTASHFNKEWGKTTGRSTTSDMLKGWGNVIRQRAGKYERLEEELFLWFSDACVTDQEVVPQSEISYNWS